MYLNSYFKWNKLYLVYIVSRTFNSKYNGFLHNDVFCILVVKCWEYYVNLWDCNNKIERDFQISKHHLKAREKIIYNANV